MAANSSISSSLKLVEAAVDDALERGALVLADDRAQREQLVAASTQRDATGWPSPSEWVFDERGREAEPAGLDATRASTCAIAASCSGVASLPTASAPIT